MLYEFLPLVAFKLPAHLGMASYTIYANVKHALGLFSILNSIPLLQRYKWANRPNSL